MAGPPKFWGARSLYPCSTKGVSGFDAHSGKAYAQKSNESIRREVNSDTRGAPKSTNPTLVRPTQPSINKQQNKESGEGESADKESEHGNADSNIEELENRVEEMEKNSS